MTANGAQTEVADQVTPIVSTSAMQKHSSNNNHVSIAKPTGVLLSSPTTSSTTATTAATTVTDSARSFGTAGSGHSGSASSTTNTTPAPKLRDNLMRRQNKNRDPSLYYETIQVLGLGSMGSVSKVKKRDSVVGGSSRDDYVTMVHGFEGLCFSLPLVGDVLRSCTGKNLGRKVKKNLFVETQGSYRKTNSIISRNTTSTMTTSGRRKDITYALKMIIVDRVQDPTFIQELFNEIDILRTLDHPNIVRPIETFHYKNNACIVMEICEGGDLFARDPYSEAHALQIVTSVLSAIEYMHSKNIVHRDLKFENIMFCDTSPNSDVKVIDFGLSKKYLPTDRLQEGVGTPYSMAPEVLKGGGYDQSVDLWSLGVVAFMLLSSSMPFFGRERKTIIRKIMLGQYQMRGRRWQKTSLLAKDFVQKLLMVNPEKRPSTGEALKHDWIRQKLFVATNSTRSNNSYEQEMEELGYAVASMETFVEYSKLKRLALMVIAHKATSQEIGFLRRVFDKFDHDLNGMIRRTEFNEVLQEFGYNEEEMDKMFAGCDLDGTGVIQYTEFLAATIEAHGVIDEEALAEAFDRMDCDDTGYISTHNLREILGDVVSSAFIEEIILEAESKLRYSENVKRQIDKKPAKDHFISYEEFMALWDQAEQEEKRFQALEKIRSRNFKGPNGSLQNIQENAPIQSVTFNIGGSDDLDDSRTSEISLEDPCALSMFQGEKMMSVRKYADI